MNKKEFLELNVKVTSFYHQLNQDDKKRFKDDFQNIDKIFEKIYFKLEEGEENKS